MLRRKLTRPVHIRLDEDADAANAIELHLDVLVLAPITLETHIVSAGVVVVLVACNSSQPLGSPPHSIASQHTLCENNIVANLLPETAALVAFNPRVVVNYIRRNQHVIRSNVGGPLETHISLRCHGPSCTDGTKCLRIVSYTLAFQYSQTGTSTTYWGQ